MAQSTVEVYSQDWDMFVVMLLIAIFVMAFGLAALKMWLTGGRPEGAPDWW